MSHIRILSEHLANQIAAGEVVERPASVVKELVENCLDAEATEITVTIEGNGTRLIRVMDNGCGMDGDDVLLCLERHATSKLQDAAELSSITTLGFRGEALPSIASVSRMTILSRPHKAEIGTRAEMRFGSLHGVHEDGCAKGTIIEIRNLFGNTPARRKFLKSARTEIFHIEEALRNLALAHPQRSFLLTVDNRTIIDTKGSENLEQRMRDIFSYKNKLLRIEHKNDSAGFHLSGYLLQPEHATTSRTRTLRTLVNSRPVRDRTISYGVSEGLRSFLMKGQQPAGALLLELPSDKLDVNVHPAKREIKFQDPKAVGRFITEAVSLAMQKFQDNMRTEIFTPSPEKQETKLNISPPTPAPKPRPEPTLSPTRPNPPQPTSIFSQKKTASATSKDDKITVYSSTPPETTATELTKEPELKSGLHYLGQLFDLYILCQQEDQLVLIDQHAAHERILYQRLRSTFLNRAIPAQTLLFSQTAELSHEQSDSLEQQRDRVKALGLHVEHFGGTTWVIKAVPAPLTGIDPLDILQEVIDSLQTASPIASQETLPASIDTLLASLACKAAIKSGRKMEKKEIIELLEQMRSTDFFSHCPHGRPVLKIVKKKEIEKWFRRI